MTTAAAHVPHGRGRRKERCARPRWRRVVLSYYLRGPRPALRHAPRRHAAPAPGRTASLYAVLGLLAGRVQRQVRRGRPGRRGVRDAASSPRVARLPRSHPGDGHVTEIRMGPPFGGPSCGPRRGRPRAAARVSRPPVDTAARCGHESVADCNATEAQPGRLPSPAGGSQVPARVTHFGHAPLTSESMSKPRSMVAHPCSAGRNR